MLYRNIYTHSVLTAICSCIPDSKVHGANMGPTCVLSAPGGPHVGPMNLAIWDILVNIGNGKGLLYDSTKPLLEPILSYY